MKLKRMIIKKKYLGENVGKGFIVIVVMEYWTLASLWLLEFVLKNETVFNSSWDKLYDGWISMQIIDSWDNLLEPKTYEF